VSAGHAETAFPPTADGRQLSAAEHKRGHAPLQAAARREDLPPTQDGRVRMVGSRPRALHLPVDRPPLTCSTCHQPTVSIRTDGMGHLVEEALSCACAPSPPAQSRQAEYLRRMLGRWRAGLSAAAVGTGVPPSRQTRAPRGGRRGPRPRVRLRRRRVHVCLSCAGTAGAGSHFCGPCSEARRALALCCDCPGRSLPDQPRCKDCKRARRLRGVCQDCPGAVRSSRAWHCDRCAESHRRLSERRWHSERYAAVRRQGESDRARVCEKCGADFVQLPGRRARWCPTCRPQSNNKPRPPRVLTCARCGETWVRSGSGRPPRECPRHAAGSRSRRYATVVKPRPGKRAAEAHREFDDFRAT
jgi:hypothetical protein